MIGPRHPDWNFIRLVGDPATAIICQSEKTELQKAEDYLHGHNLDEAAICLRKAAEDMAKRYREWTEKRKLPPGEFFTLSENLRAAKKSCGRKFQLSSTTAFSMARPSCIGNTSYPRAMTTWTRYPVLTSPIAAGSRVRVSVCACCSKTIAGR